MKLQVVGCSHHDVSIALRERLAFGPEQAAAALDQWREAHPEVEAVLLSTCNRIEFYTAAEDASSPDGNAVVRFLAQFHQLDPAELENLFYTHAGEDAARHLFTVAASLDSMVVGEPQILSQVKQAYQLAVSREGTGPLVHLLFQAALKAARRVAAETTIGQHRVSVPSVAVADFARQIFERFDDKQTLVIGAGEMAEETLQYLQAEGARDITVVNRSPDRARRLAQQWEGRATDWDQRFEALVEADLVISTTGSKEPIVTSQTFVPVEARRGGRPLFVLDLAVPRDFDPAVGDRPDVYLYSIDDLREACDRNRAERDKALPAATRILHQETDRFMTDLRRRATAPVIRRLRQDWQKPKEEEIQRLWNKLPDLDDRSRDEIRQSFDRLVNKLLHPPLESLRDESRHGIPSALMEALARLFQLKD